MITTLLLLGGDSLRFREAGYTASKAVLAGPRGTILDSVLEGLMPEHLVTAGRARDTQQIEPAIKASWPCPRTEVWADGPALGPLYGLLDAERSLLSLGDGELVISYCDVILARGIFGLLAEWRAANAESGAVVFESCNPRFGYWAGDHVVEKDPVSKLAVSGVFYFRSTFDALARAHRQAKWGAGIVDLLDAKTVLAQRPAAEIIDVGTPTDYERFLLESVRL